MEILIFASLTAVMLYVAVKIFLIGLNKEDTYKKERPKSKPVGYRLFYSDQKQSLRENGVIYSKLLTCESLGLVGKPDYIYKKGQSLYMPVEIKSGSIGERDNPYLGDLMQIAAYFAIIEESFEGRVKEGRIIYSDFMFTVKNTKKLSKKLRQSVQDMREMLVSGEAEPAASYPLCKNCICRGTVCEYFE